MLKLLVVYCNDIERAKYFYELLGFAFQKEQHGQGPMHYSCQAGELVFELYPGKEASKLRLGFKLEKLEDVLLSLEKKGVAVHRKEEMAFVHDPEGRVVELYR